MEALHGSLPGSVQSLPIGRLEYEVPRLHLPTLDHDFRKPFLSVEGLLRPANNSAPSAVWFPSNKWIRSKEEAVSCGTDSGPLRFVHWFLHRSIFISLTADEDIHFRNQGCVYGWRLGIALGDRQSELDDEDIQLRNLGCVYGWRLGVRRLGVRRRLGLGFELEGSVGLAAEVWGDGPRADLLPVLASPKFEGLVIGRED